LLRNFALRWGARKGLQRKAHRKAPKALSEDLQRKARFFSVWEFAAQIPKPKKMRHYSAFYVCRLHSSGAILYTAGSGSTEEENEDDFWGSWCGGFGVRGVLFARG
jgi:hypothetical protein